MRTFVGILIVFAVLWGVHSQFKHAESAPQTQVATTTTPPPVAPSATHWPKSALDRADDVKRQVLAQRKANNAE
ncbi:MAG: hypothetical protein M3Y86_03020 [Verrucomicrobiota bacterium]|nr:hypothetical protein [Verrucomicrobiota bacterium]